MAFTRFAIVTVASGTVSADLSNFPLYIDLADMPASLWSDARSNGGDIRVFASDGSTQIPFDLVAYDPTLEQGSLFVRTNLNTGSDNTVIIKWGDPALNILPVTDTYGRNATWSGFRAVSMFGRDMGDRTGVIAAPESVGDGHSFLLDGTVATLSTDPHQGGVWDGTHHYLIDNNAIYKYDASWNLVDTNSDPIGDTGLAATTSPDVNHCGDPAYHDGKLYIPLEYYLNSSTFSGQHIAVFDCSDLSFITAYDISAQGREISSITYCDRDGYLYIIGFETNRQLLDKYSITGTFIGSLSVTQNSGARQFSQAQGICWWKDAFWVTIDNDDEVLRIEYSGLNQPTNGLFGSTVSSGNFEGIWAVDDSLYILTDPTSANSFVQKWTPFKLPLMAGGGFDNLNSAGTSHATFPLTGEYSTFTMGVSARITDKTANRALLTYYDHVGGSGSNDRASLSYRQAEASFGVWDDVNTWLMPATDFDPSTSAYSRFAVVYNGSTSRILYANGTAIATSGAITARTGFSALNVGRDDADNNEKFYGFFGYAYLINAVLSADWIAADYNNLNSPSTFYSIAEGDLILNVVPATGPTSGGASVTINGVGFTSATGVLFDTDPATSVVVVNDTTITCNIPAHALGLVDVTVERPTTDLVLVNGFTYTDTPAPSFISITPDYGKVSGGTAVTIIGDNFTDVTDVEIGGNPVTSLVIVDDETITAVTPAGTQGLANVELFSPNGDTLASDAFLYNVRTFITQVPILFIHTPPQPVLITQIPLLVVNIPVQGLRITQIPLLVVNIPVQGLRITQVPTLPIWFPTPIPFPAPIVPEVPVVEYWEWKTTLNIAERGKEQRSALRAHPRMGMNFDAVILNDDDRQLVYQMMFKYIKQVFNYPMYHYSVKLAAAASAGATKLFFNPAHTDLRDNEVVALFDPHLEKTLYLTIAAVDADGANLASALPIDIPEYFLICPAPRFKVETPSFSMNGVDGGFSMSLEGAQVRNVLRADQSTTLTLIDGMPLLDKRPLANSAVDENFDQDVVWVDNKVADPEPKTNWFAPLISGDREFLIHRPVDMDFWRAFANALRGRQNPFLLPTFRNDLPLYSTPALGATEFQTSNIQFFDFWRSKAWRYIRIQSSAGVIYRRINEVIDHYDADGNPIYMTVKLASSIGAGTGANSNMVISFVNTVRLDSDTITLEHGPIDTVLSMKVRMIEE